MSEGLTLNTEGAERGFFVCSKGNTRFSGEKVIRQTRAAHPLSAGTSCTAFICSLLKSLRVSESCFVDRYFGVRAFILSLVTSIPNRRRLCPQTCVRRVPPARGGEWCHP